MRSWSEFETSLGSEVDGGVNPAGSVQQRVREFGRRISAGGVNRQRLQSVCGWGLAKQRARR